jgi:hypothetical protein
VRADDDVLRGWRARLDSGLDSAMTVRVAATTAVDAALRALDTVAGTPTRPSANATLVQHRDLEAWFQTSFVPADMRWNQIRDVPPPAVLAAAREALASILVRPAES